MKTFLALSLVLLMGLAGTASAAPKTPLEIVQSLYAPYLADPHAKHPDIADSLHAIADNASPSLKKALTEEQACQKKEGVCAVDSDIIINGQDWDLSNFKIKAFPRQGDQQRVQARFINAGTISHINYYFISTSHGWKIDEVDAQAVYKDSDESGEGWQLKSSITGFMEGYNHE